MSLCYDIHLTYCSDEGLQKDDTTMAQIPSYVKVIPNGTETGTYLAVDLGGTNFRVCSVHLHGNSTYTLVQSKSSIPRNVMVTGTYRDLFGFLATSIQQFMKDNHNDELVLHNLERDTREITEEFRRARFRRMGFTFSFTFAQHSLNRGTLLKWTKGFDIPDAVGQDPSKMLQEALDALHLPILVTALANDTVGTLMARSYTAPGTSTTLLGAIFGTGTNGAYVEKMANISKLHPDPEFSSFKPGDSMIINTEWGSFDNELAVLPNTSYDAAVDRDSVNPGDQLFEKRISGMYLGEILRRIVLSIVDEPTKYRFDMEISDSSALFTQWGIDTSFLSIVAADSSADLTLARAEIRTSLGAHSVSVEDAAAIQILAKAVGRRAARLAAVALAAIVLKSGRLEIAVPNSDGAATQTKASEDLASRGLAKRHQRTSSRPMSTVRRALTWMLSPTFPTESHRSTPNNSAPILQVDPSKNVTKNGEFEKAGSDGTIDIGVDGSLIEFYPSFEAEMRGALREVEGIGLAGEQRIRIGLAKDGSGVGAALIARAAEEQERENSRLL